VVITGGPTIKYSADGTAVWTNNGYASAVAVEGNGNVVIAGGGAPTIKYSADGTAVWTNNNGGGHTSAVAVDGSGNVVVTGFSYGTNSDLDLYTAKYAAANGALLWEKRYDGPVNRDDQGVAVGVDASGNVVVTGTSCNGSVWNYSFDYYTAEYAAADGALLWEKRYNGPANGDELMSGSHSLALGPNGMVAITGSSDGNSSGVDATWDYATIVYRETLPSLSIARSNAFVIVSWPSSATGFLLEQNTDLTGTNWTTPSEAVTDNGTTKSITVSPGPGNRLFRLRLNQ